jgi:hypothetical protein
MTVNTELGKMWKELVMPDFKVYISIRLEENHENFQDSLCPGQD